MNGFKAVYHKSDGTLVSSSVHDWRELCTIYTPGQPASNPAGPLMFFGNIGDAKFFLTDQISIDHEIWFCVAKEARRCPFELAHLEHPTENIRLWWEKTYEIDFVIPTPFGTYVADTITLVRRVDRDA